MTYRIAIRTITFALALGAGCTTRSPRTPPEVSLVLSYQEFDQTPHSGWRVLAQDEKRYVEAATLIEAYLDQHSELDRFQRVNLHWHAAQVLAIAGATTPALKHMESARLNPEPTKSPVRWNDYVEATTAFLRGDRAGLVAARDRIAEHSPGDANLPVVDSLLEHFGMPYATAYRATKRPANR
jgi:hypothetical protein